MEEKQTRRQQAENTKRHIFHTAIRLLEDRDFEDIKIKDIVSAANVSVGSFYNYFTSKLDVYYETYQCADEYFATTVAAKMTHSTARERILCFFDEYARYCSELTDIKLTKLLFTSSNTHFERIVEEGMHKVLLQQVQFGLDRGELRASLPAYDIVQFLMITVRGLVYNWCTRNGDYDLRTAMEAYVSRLLCSL